MNMHTCTLYIFVVTQAYVYLALLRVPACIQTFAYTHACMCMYMYTVLSKELLSY